MTIRPRRRMRAEAQQQEPRQRGGGEQLDLAAEQSIRLAHRALERFPDLVRRHKYVAGGAAVAGALVVLASVAIARRMRRGQTSEEAVESLTEAEIGSLESRERDPDDDHDSPAEPTPITRSVSYSNGASTSGAAAPAGERGPSEI